MPKCFEDAERIIADRNERQALRRPACRTTAGGREGDVRALDSPPRYSRDRPHPRAVVLAALSAL
jgi:hypothetical protein